MGYLSGYPARRISTLSGGLLGFGRIAKNVARYMKAFGAKGYTFEPFLPESVFEEHHVIRAKTKNESFETCDIITLNIPLVDETALIDGLKSGKIRAAALDVFEKEPLPANSPLMEMRNVILTTHVAFQTEESYEELQRKAVECAIQGARGEMPAGTVNRDTRK